MRFSILLVTGTILLAGCENPKAANNDNFGKAVSAYLANQETIGAYCAGPKAFPYQVEEATGPDLPIQGLLETGLIKITGQQPTMMGFWKQTAYDLTPTGSDSFTRGRGFCLGKPALTRIVNFTDPGSAGTMSRVTYVYRLKDVPTWASSLTGQEFRYGVPAAYGDVTKTDTFVLTGNGWAQESLAPR